MPNWCYTNMEIRGDKEDLLKFYDFSEDLRNKGIESYGKDGVDFGASWLGYYLAGAGIPKEEFGKHYQCRGKVTSFSTKEDIEDMEIIQLETETAWGPMVETIQFIVDLSGLDLTLHYYAEECGMEMYVASDKSMTDNAEYILEHYQDMSDEELETQPELTRKIMASITDRYNDFADTQFLKELFTKVYGAIPMSFDDQLKKFQDDVEDLPETLYVRLHKIDFDDDSDVYASAA